MHVNAIHVCIYLAGQIIYVFDQNAGDTIYVVEKGKRRGHHLRCKKRGNARYITYVVKKEKAQGTSYYIVEKRGNAEDIIYVVRKGETKGTSYTCPTTCRLETHGGPQETSHKNGKSQGTSYPRR